MKFWVKVERPFSAFSNSKLKFLNLFLFYLILSNDPYIVANVPFPTLS